MSIILIILLVLLSGAIGAIVHFLFMWFRRDAKQEPSLEEIRLELEEWESKYSELAARFKKLEALDEGQTFMVREVLREELNNQKKEDTKLNILISFVVGAVFFLLGFFANQIFM